MKLRDSNQLRNHGTTPFGLVSEAIASAGYPNLHKFVNHPHFEELLELMSKGYWACGQYAIEDGKVDYWKGVQDGLNAFFEAVNASVLAQKELFKRAMAQRDQDVPDKDDPNAARAEEPSIMLGGSSM